MALKIEHSCSRCHRVTTTEVQDLAAAAEAETVEKKRAVVLADIQEFLAGINPELMPDLLIIQRDLDPIVQTHLCADDDAKRSCAQSVLAIIDGCKTFSPRKPKTKKVKTEETTKV